MRNLLFGMVVFVFVGILGGAAAAQTEVTVTNNGQFAISGVV
jgi:hypothetical protein